jgi:hypothetical protein
MLTDEQRNQIEDILRLIPPDERATFLDMLAHDLRGREPSVGAEDRLAEGELRRVAEHTWRNSSGTAGQSTTPEMRHNGRP